MIGSADRLERPAAPLLVFDIETIPDTPSLWGAAISSGKLTPEEEAIDPLDVWGDLTKNERALEALGYDFAPQLYQAVVSVCALFVHPESYQIMGGRKLTLPAPDDYSSFLENERRLLEDFWTFSKKHEETQNIWYDQIDSEYRLTDYQRRKLKPIPLTFCGYNITGFDLPVLEQRSLRHLLACPIRQYGQETGYDSYRSRYAFDRTFDLYQYLYTMGSSTRVGLNAFAQAIGLGGKMKGMHGSQVAAEYFVERNPKRIEDYCATDVLITYGVLLAIQKFRGILTAKDFSLAVDEFKKFLLKEGRPETYRELAEQSESFFRQGLPTSL